MIHNYFYDRFYSSFSLFYSSRDYLEDWVISIFDPSVSFLSFISDFNPFKTLLALILTCILFIFECIYNFYYFLFNRNSTVPSGENKK